jgi:short-subunit dehydrogenase
MGREVARRLAERGESLFFFGRDPTRLEETAQDLRVRGADNIGHTLCDLSDIATFEPALDAAEQHLGRLDTLIITAGLFGTQEQLEDDLDLTQAVLDVNFTKTIVMCEHARPRLMAGGGGMLVVFSSVAGDRGRKTVGLYGASKAGLSHYLESLDHRFRSKGLVTVCVKPGFVRTGMTHGLSEPPFASNPEDAADAVIAAIDGRRPQVYATAIWGLVMLVVRNLPRFVMRRVGF